MNDDFFALVDTDALKALSGQPSASGAAMLLVDTHGLIRAQTAAAGELLELENGDLLASALSDEAVALVEDCASGGGANSMTEHLDVGDCRLTVVPHPDGALVALEPQPLRLPRGLSYVCGDTLNASIARLYDLAAKAPGTRRRPLPRDVPPSAHGLPCHRAARPAGFRHDQRP